MYLNIYQSANINSNNLISNKYVKYAFSLKSDKICNINFYLSSLCLKTNLYIVLKIIYSHY